MKRFVKFVRICFYLGSKIFHLKKHIRGRNNRINVPRVLFSRTNFIIQGNNNTITIKEGSIIKNQLIYIIGDNNNVEIGENCFLKGKKIHVEGNGCEVKVGGKTTIEFAEIACTEDKTAITIGKDCMFADDIDIRNGDSHSIIDIKTGNRTNYSEDIIIGDHVWIGSHSIILKGVKIKNESIVGSGSVVTRDISKNSICAGVPATVIKTGITWERERILK